MIDLPEDLLTGFDESNLINPQKESIKSSNEEDDDALLNDLLGNEDATGELFESIQCL